MANTLSPVRSRPTKWGNYVAKNALGDIIPRSPFSRVGSIKAANWMSVAQHGLLGLLGLLGIFSVKLLNREMHEQLARREQVD